VGEVKPTSYTKARRPHWLDDRMNDLRRQLSPADDESLCLLFLERLDQPTIVVTVVPSAMRQMDTALTAGIAHVIDTVPARAVLLVVPRRHGTTQAVDRKLWDDLHAGCRRPQSLMDLIVMGRRCHTSTRWAASVTG